MRKILIAFDGSHFSEGALELASNLNSKNPILLTGAFLPQVDLANLWSHSRGGLSGKDFVPMVEEEQAVAIRQNIRRFQSYCLAHNIECRVHKDYFDFALQELKRESRFADLLIISSETFFESPGTNEPNEYLKEALHSAACPAIVVPEKFDLPSCNILTYDGSDSSVFAIKQFAYILPEMTRNETILVYVKEDGEELLPDETNIAELVTRHFSKVELFRLEANPKKFFDTWLLEKKSAILVSGAYGRSGISRSFHASFINIILKEHRIPVFVAHK